MYIWSSQWWTHYYGSRPKPVCVTNNISITTTTHWSRLLYTLHHKLVPEKSCISTLLVPTPSRHDPLYTATEARHACSPLFSPSTGPHPTPSSGPAISVGSLRPAKSKQTMSVPRSIRKQAEVIRVRIDYLDVCHFSQKHFFLFHPDVLLLDVAPSEFLEAFLESRVLRVQLVRVGSRLLERHRAIRTPTQGIRREFPSGRLVQASMMKTRPAPHVLGSFELDICKRHDSAVIIGLVSLLAEVVVTHHRAHLLFPCQRQIPVNYPTTLLHPRVLLLNLSTVYFKLLYLLFRVVFPTYRAEWSA